MDFDIDTLTPGQRDAIEKLIRQFRADVNGGGIDRRYAGKSHRDNIDLTLLSSLKKLGWLTTGRDRWGLWVGLTEEAKRGLGLIKTFDIGCEICLGLGQVATSGRIVKCGRCDGIVEDRNG